MDWKIYYSRYVGPGEDNFYTVSSDESSWEEAPMAGVLVVLVADDTWGRFMLHNHEHFYKTDGREVMCSESIEALKAHVPGIKDEQIKNGGNAFQEDWYRIISVAGHDLGFPRKTPRRRTKDWPVDDPRRPKI